MISVILPFRTTPCCHSERWYTVILSVAKNLVLNTVVLSF